MGVERGIYAYFEIETITFIYKVAVNMISGLGIILFECLKYEFD
jgi:hypothetical protein